MLQRERVCVHVYVTKRERENVCMNWIGKGGGGGRRGSRDREKVCVLVGCMYIN